MLETRGGKGKRKSFQWEYYEGFEVLIISNGNRDIHYFWLHEIMSVLKEIKYEFGDKYFPLANDVAKLWAGTEIRGLGTIILDQWPGNTLHALGASYFGRVFEDIGYFLWNKKRRGIKWKLINGKIDEEVVAAYLTVFSPKLERFQI
jgi:hypothetical protein